MEVIKKNSGWNSGDENYLWNEIYTELFKNRLDIWKENIRELENITIRKPNMKQRKEKKLKMSKYLWVRD